MVSRREDDVIKNQIFSPIDLLIYLFCGFSVPEEVKQEVVEQPKKLTLKDISRNWNSESSKRTPSNGHPSAMAGIKKRGSVLVIDDSGKHSPSSGTTKVSSHQNGYQDSLSPLKRKAATEHKLFDPKQWKRGSPLLPNSKK